MFFQGKGKRFNIIHAGGIDGALMILVNEEMNSEKFENWLKNQLLPNIKEKPSVIVLDNALPHSR